MFREFHKRLSQRRSMHCAACGRFEERSKLCEMVIRRPDGSTYLRELFHWNCFGQQCTQVKYDFEIST